MPSLSHETVSINVAETSDIGHARRRAVVLAKKLGLDETRRGELALIVTEAGTNLLQHAGGGELLIRPFARDRAGVEVIALDKGPGIANVAKALEDGYSTGGSRGVGLGSIARLADSFDVYSREGAGTALLATCLAPHTAGLLLPRADYGVVCVAYPGEEVPGDAWAVEEHDHKTSVLLVDGLGHGPLACEAAMAATHIFEQAAAKGPHDAMTDIHRALHRTRGAAGAVAEIDWKTGSLRFVGIGNISAAIVSDERVRRLSSHNGTLGEQTPRFQEFEYEWPAGSMLVLHSDGVSERWALDAYPGLAMKQPSLIAGVLYRDFARRRDDATILVLRERP